MLAIFHAKNVLNKVSDALKQFPVLEPRVGTLGCFRNII